ncbi:MAG: NMD3-related protein [Promethearchaeota archaeon]
MPHRFCAICGINIKKDSPHVGLCLSCFLKENPLFDIPTNFDIKICPDCGSYSKREEWIQVDANDIFSIIEQAVSRFLLKPYLKSEKISFRLDYSKPSFEYTSEDRLCYLQINIRGQLKDDEKINSEQIIKVNINYELCKNCLNLRSGSYFLSILQLRVSNEIFFNLIKEALDYIQLYVEKLFERDKKQYISKVLDQKYGLDLMLSTNELLNHIISHLRNKFHFILKRTKKLIGRDIQKGKNIYRLKSLVRFLPFRKNDIIEIENHKYIIDNITKNKIVLKNEDNQKLVEGYSFFFSQKNFFKIIGGNNADDK